MIGQFPSFLWLSLVNTFNLLNPLRRGAGTRHTQSKNISDLFKNKLKGSEDNYELLDSIKVGMNEFLYFVTT